MGYFTCSLFGQPPPLLRSVVLLLFPSLNIANMKATSKGNASASHNASSLGNAPWTIDSDANRHMTGFSKSFLNYLLCLNNDTVRIANDSSTPNQDP